MLKLHSVEYGVNEMGAFYTIKTFHKGIVAKKRETGAIFNVWDYEIGVKYDCLYLYLPDSTMGIGFLISADDAALSLSPMEGRFGVLPIGVAGDRMGIVAFYDPHTSLWCCAVPPDPSHPACGLLSCDRRKIADFERMTLIVQPPAFVPTSVALKAKSLDAWRNRPFDLALLRAAEAENAPFIAAVSQFVSQSELEALAESLLHSPADAQHLARLFPDDMMAQQGLPVLANWVAAKHISKPVTTPRPISRLSLFRSTKVGNTAGSVYEPTAKPTEPCAILLDEKFDRLATLGREGQQVSLPHSLTALARQRVVPRKELCIIATARNEGLYIVEWAAYHRAIGVQTIFLYTNDNDDGSNLLLSALHRAGVINWVDSKVAEGGDAQHKAYGHALTLRPEILDYRWALIIDLDEYLMLNPDIFQSATDFLRWHENTGADAIGLNWVFHGPAGETHWRDDFIGRRFPYEVGHVDMHIKSLCRPRYFIHSTPHFPRRWRNAPFAFQAADGGPHVPKADDGTLAFSSNPTANMAWINHYFLKSSEEFLWKWSRNRGNYATLSNPSNTVLTANFVHYFMQEFSGRIREQTAPEQCAPGFGDEYNRIVALPDVANALAQVKRIYAERVKTIVPMFLDAPGINNAGDAGQAFLRTLGL